MDEGLPVAYQVLDSGIPAYSAEGVQVGTVDHVVAAPAQDIFHGLVLQVGGTPRFLEADQVAALHERGVDLKITAAEASALPEPHGAAPVWRDREPGVKPTPWSHLVGLVGGKHPHGRDWTKED